MPRKVFQLQVELDIQAVTCPGVWLCPNGNVNLQLFMLDSCVQTIATEPIFPLLYHEKFIFYKIFYKAHRLSDLQKLLNRERMYAELIQWHNYEAGNVLATFEMCLSDLLYPTTNEGAIAGVDVDLLMESTKHFPGIISPKIEVSTRTTVEETLCRGEHKRCTAFVINPKVITSTNATVKSNKLHQRKVCHSLGYHRSHKTHPSLRCLKKPPFVVRRVDEDLINRRPQANGSNVCNCRLRRTKSVNSFLSSDESCLLHANRTDDFFKNRMSKRQSRSPDRARKCCCCDRGRTDGCTVCSKYKNIFRSVSPQRLSPDRRAPSPVRTKLYQSCRCRNLKTPPKPPHCSCCNTCLEKQQSQDEESRNVTFNSCCHENDCCMLDSSGTLQHRNPECLCIPRTRSLATQLHEKLTNTLRQSTDCLPCIDNGSCKMQINSADSVWGSGKSSSACTCPSKVRNTGKKDFYENIERFYDKLFKKKCSESERQQCACVP